MLKKLFVIVLIIPFLFAGLVQAQSDDLPEPGMLPNHPLYFLKSWSESIGTFFTFGEERKAERLFELSERRLSETIALSEHEDSSIAEEAIERYQKQLEQAIQKAKEAKDKGMDMDELLEKISERTLKHQEVLADVYEKVPNEAKPAIQRAMEKSIRGHEESLTNISEERAPEVMERIEIQRNEATTKMEDARERGVPVPTLPIQRDEGLDREIEHTNDPIPGDLPERPEIPDDRPEAPHDQGSDRRPERPDTPGNTIGRP